MLGHTFRTSETCFTRLCALVWSAHDELMHVHDCIMSVFQSAWFGNFFITAALECAKHGELFAAQKQSACCPNAKTTVCGKCETTERIKWMNPGIYLIRPLQSQRVAKTNFGAHGRPQCAYAAAMFRDGPHLRSRVVDIMIVFKAMQLQGAAIER